MTRFTKISLTALFALFLTACDKPAENTATPEPAKASVQPQQEIVSDEQGAKDFKKMLEWTQVKSQQLFLAQQELEMKFNQGNLAEVPVALDQLKQSLDNLLVNIDQIDIKHPEVIVFKDKIKKSFVLSSDLIAYSVSVVFKGKEASEADLSMIEQKRQAVLQATSEFEQVQQILHKKFGQ